MRSALLGAFCIVLAAAAQANSESSFGTCELSGNVALVIGERIEWDLDTSTGTNSATIRRIRSSISGEVINIREHDDGTPHGRKINLGFWPDDRGDFLELVVMHRSVGSSVGGVRYVLIEDEAFADVIIPFSDAVCAYR